MPSARAICSSLAPAASCWSRKRRSSGLASPRSRSGHDGRPLPHQLEEQGQRLDDPALPDQQPRLVGEPQGLGEDRVRRPDDDQPGRQVGDHPDLLAGLGPGPERVGGLVQGADRVDRPRPAARGDRGGDDLRHRRLPGHLPGVRTQPQQVAAALLDQRREQLERVPAPADLAVELADLLDVAPSRPRHRGGEERDGRRQLDQPVPGQLGHERLATDLVCQHVGDAADDEPAVRDPGDLAGDQRGDHLGEVVDLHRERGRHHADVAPGQRAHPLVEPFLLTGQAERGEDRRRAGHVVAGHGGILVTAAFTSPVARKGQWNAGGSVTVAPSGGRPAPRPTSGDVVEWFDAGRRRRRLGTDPAPFRCPPLSAVLPRFRCPPASRAPVASPLPGGPPRRSSRQPWHEADSSRAGSRPRPPTG